MGDSEIVRQQLIDVANAKDQRITFRIGGRRSGKTTAVLDWLEKAIQDNSNAYPVIVCPTRDFSENLYRQAVSRGLVVGKDQFVTLDQVRRGFLRGVNIRLAAEEIQWILEDIIGHELEYVTATGKSDG